MKAFVRQVLFLALAALLSWWAFLRAPEKRGNPEASAQERPLVVAWAGAEPAQDLPSEQLQPAPVPKEEKPEARAPKKRAEQQPPAKPKQEQAPQPELEKGAPPPVSELGAPEGDENSPPGLLGAPKPPLETPPAGAQPEQNPVPQTEPDSAPSKTDPLKSALAKPAPPERAKPDRLQLPKSTFEAQSETNSQAEAQKAPSQGPRKALKTAHASVQQLMVDPALLESAQAELNHSSSHGFATVLLAAPEDQLAIARFFGEELVLVPRSAIDPDAKAPRYFRITPRGPAHPEMVRERPHLESYLQYRDLFDYEYSHLPAPLRELRRSVLSRDEIYLFACLIPTREWALVIARRNQSLIAAGRKLSKVRRFVLRYVRAVDGQFDLRVEEIVFTKGDPFRPSTLKSEPRST